MRFKTGSKSVTRAQIVDGLKDVRWIYADGIEREHDTGEVACARYEKADSPSEFGNPCQKDDQPRMGDPLRRDRHEWAGVREVEDTRNDAMT